MRTDRARGCRGGACTFPRPVKQKRVRSGSCCRSGRGRSTRRGSGRPGRRRRHARRSRAAGSKVGRCRQAPGTATPPGRQRAIRGGGSPGQGPPWVVMYSDCIVQEHGVEGAPRVALSHVPGQVLSHSGLSSRRRASISSDRSTKVISRTRPLGGRRCRAAAAEFEGTDFVGGSAVRRRRNAASSAHPRVRRSTATRGLRLPETGAGSWIATLVAPRDARPEPVEGQDHCPSTGKTRMSGAPIRALAQTLETVGGQDGLAE